MDTKVTAEHINSVIVCESYTVLPSIKTVICELSLKNGYSVVGEASVISKVNFNKDLGKQVALANAKRKLVQLESYLLQQNIYDRTVEGKLSAVDSLIQSIIDAPDEDILQSVEDEYGDRNFLANEMKEIIKKVKESNGK